VGGGVGPEGFTALLLDRLRPLRGRASMTHEALERFLDSYQVVCASGATQAGRLASQRHVRAIVAVGATSAAELARLLEQRFLEKPAREWIGLLREAKVPCGPVYDTYRGQQDFFRAVAEDP
jgi:hypothetical protein